MNKASLRQRIFQGFAKSNPFRSLYAVITTFVVTFATMIGSYFVYLHCAYLLPLMVVFLALLLVRVFTLQHDCGHMALFKTPRYNHWVGLMCSVLTLFPYYYWRVRHAKHHLSSGNLDERGVGDIPLFTAKEYKNSPWWLRWGYHFIRNPWVLFLFGAFWEGFVQMRYVKADTPGKDKRKYHLNVHLSTLCFALIHATIIIYCGIVFYLTMILLPLWLAAVLGSILFYLQHNYDGSYFVRKSEWDEEASALQGSSYFKLPRLLAWFTGNIGYHHIHHLCPLVPMYRLPECHKAMREEFKIVKRLYLRSIPHVSKLVLFDENRNCFITWRQYRALYGRPSLKPKLTVDPAHSPQSAS